MAIILIKLLGILLTYIGGYSLFADLFKRIRCKEITQGKVVDIYEHVKNKSKGKIKTFLYPIFEYNVYGQTYTEKFNIGSRSSFFSILYRRKC